MVYNTENQIKNVLGINAWRNLLSSKIVLFTGMMPEMNHKLMMDLVGQLPQFWFFSKEALTTLENQAVSRLDHQFAYRLKEIRKLLDNDLDIDQSSAKDKLNHLETILKAIDASEKLSAMSDSDRQFITTLQKSAEHSTRNCTIAALTFIGGQLKQR